MPRQPSTPSQPLDAHLASALRSLCVADHAGGLAGLLGDAPASPPSVPQRCGSKSGRFPSCIGCCTSTGHAACDSPRASAAGEARPAWPGTPRPATLPSGPAAADVFVHSPYCFPLAPNRTDGSCTPLGMELPPVDPVIRLSYVSPAPLLGVPSGPIQRRKPLRGGDARAAAPAAPAWPSPNAFPPDRVRTPPATAGAKKADPVAQSECPHPKPWKRRRAQRGFAFYVCLHCQHEWRVVTAKALRRQQESQPPTAEDDSVLA